MGCSSRYDMHSKARNDLLLKQVYSFRIEFIYQFFFVCSRKLLYHFLSHYSLIN